MRGGAVNVRPNTPMIIYTAGSCKARVWQRTETSASEFINRLSISQTLPCTRAEYFAMKKPEQDRLKDIGGYVLGELKDGRRKNCYVLNRCAAALDMDNLPPGATEEVLRRISGLGVAAVVHSTAKYAPENPRLRAVVFFSRTVSPDEYEPICRKLAFLIQPEMTWFDPSTTESARLMFWAVHCSDSAPVFQVFEGNGVLDVDAMLAQYSDWHDVSSWPRFPRETPPEKRAEKQTDPTSKKGIVGAFCRTYDIPRTISELLPSVYTETDIPGRYTYAEGSTAGGAVVYDNGNFLYSHHATDPCGGKLVNAFDLVRLHKFGAQDDDAKEDTPTNRLPSYCAMESYARSLPEVAELEKRERGQEVVRDFGGLRSQSADDDLASFLGGLKGCPLTKEVVSDLLSKLGITVRLNVITNKNEVFGAPASWSRENTVNNLPVYLRDWLKTAGVKGVGKDAICDSLAVINDEQRYNPVMQMLYAFEWDGVDRLQTVYEILGITADGLSCLLVRKWLWQCVALAHNLPDAPFGADGVLTLSGDQGIGKTSFFRWLAYDPRWFCGGVAINFAVKDSLLKALGVWICELGELGSTLKRDLDQLKAFLLDESDNIRAPYAREAVKRPRYTSFCATVNGDSYLNDETGNRRLWTVPVQSIDLPRMRGLGREWLQQLWMQVLTLYKENPQGFRLTPEERRQLEGRNRDYGQPLPCEAAVMDLLDFTLPVEKWRAVSAGTVAAFAGLPKNSDRQAGRVLTRLVKKGQCTKLPRTAEGRLYNLPVKLVCDVTQLCNDTPMT